MSLFDIDNYGPPASPNEYHIFGARPPFGKSSMVLQTAMAMDPEFAPSSLAFDIDDLMAVRKAPRGIRLDLPVQDLPVCEDWPTCQAGDDGCEACRVEGDRQQRLSDAYDQAEQDALHALEEVL